MADDDIKTKEQLLEKVRYLKSKIVELEKEKTQCSIWLDNSPVCINIIDPDFNLQYMSNSGIEKLKIDDITEFYGKPYPPSFFPDSFRLTMIKNLKEVKQRGETIRQEAPIQDLEGNTLWSHSTIVPVYEDEGQLDHILIVSLDTTAQKQVEEALVQSEATVSKKLKAIIEPKEGIEGLELSDIIDVEILHSLMEDFYQLTGMLGAVLDISGKVLVAVGWQDICTKFHRSNPDTLKNCVESDTILTRGVSEGTFKAYQCKNNMWDIVTPIIVGGAHVGNVFIGQYFLEGEVPDYEFFRKQALKYGFDETEYLDALDRVPRFTKEAVDAGMKFYSRLAGVISTLSFSSIQQSRMLARQKQTESDLLKAKEKAEESEKKYRDLVNLTQEGIWVIDENSITTFVNPSMARILRYTPEEMIGKSLFDFMDESGVRIANANIERRREGKREQHDFEFICKDGERIFCTIETAPILDNTGTYQGAIAGVIDITERKRAEEDIKKSQSLLQKAEELSNQGAWEWNISRDEWTFSENWLHIHGCKLSGIKREELMTIAYPEDAPAVEKAFQNALNGISPYALEHRIVRQNDGKVRYIRAIGDFIYNESGEKVLMYGVTQDITEEKQAEEKIRIAEENLKKTFDISPGIISKANVETGYFIEVNQAVTRILGYSVEEFKSRPLMEFVHPDDRQRTVDEISEQKSGNKTTFFENRYLCKNGSYKWIAWNSTDVDKNGIVTAIGSDISERKKVEDELIRAKEKAEESDRLKSAFLANMSHEIRTPMNGLLGFVHLLNDPNLSKAKTEQYTDIINKSSERLLNTINDIIDISKIEAGEMTVSHIETSVDDEMNELYSFFLPEAKQKGLSLSLESSLSTERTKIVTDSNKLHGILSNLIKNAIKYTKKGSIEFGYIVKKEPEPIQVEFFVRDTGVGIPRERIKAVFNRFEQADTGYLRVFEGSGLGLSISKAYAEMLGGELSVASDEGRGSTFTLIIPYQTLRL